MNKRFGGHGWTPPDHVVHQLHVAVGRQKLHRAVAVAEVQLKGRAPAAPQPRAGWRRAFFLLVTAQARPQRKCGIGSRQRLLFCLRVILVILGKVRAVGRRPKGQLHAAAPRCRCFQLLRRRREGIFHPAQPDGTSVDSRQRVSRKGPPRRSINRNPSEGSWPSLPPRKMGK